uniref:Uncharacterized protein n=1 Tax=Arundo donax TaxID=35708 RepID=A0A0A8YJR1_ARUDO
MKWGEIGKRGVSSFLAFRKQTFIPTCLVKLRQLRVILTNPLMASKTTFHVQAHETLDYTQHTIKVNQHRQLSLLRKGADSSISTNHLRLL